jgi:hypothetical protein
MVEGVIRAVDRRQIPSGQYRAILIDEGHDFAPPWLRLVTQMVDPETNSLLLLYDDAQSIYERQRNRQFSFKSVGIQAQGRTTILKIKDRNTRQILQTASLIAAELLSPDEKDEGGIPLVQPVSCGREGAEPVFIQQEAHRIVDLSAACTTAKGTPGVTWPSSAVTMRPWTPAHRHCGGAACRCSCASARATTTPPPTPSL